jgi:hypothetical protein
VKGIGGSPVSLQGTGSVDLPLKADDGSIAKITIRNAVYVPASPFNLILPQLLIAELKRANYDVDYAKHDEFEYIFTYKAASAPPNAIVVTVLESSWFTSPPASGNPHIALSPMIEGCWLCVGCESSDIVCVCDCTNFEANRSIVI